MKTAMFLGLLLVGQSQAADAPTSAPPILVVPDKNYDWAAIQIGAALSGEVSYHQGSLFEALQLAQHGKASGVVEIKLDTASAFESGRVVCYAPSGKMSWEEKVMFNLGGGEERIARRFAESLANKVTGKTCP
jgi:hypothetical protein